MKYLPVIFFVIILPVSGLFAQEPGEWIFLNTAQDSAVYEQDEWIWGYSGSASRFHQGRPQTGQLQPVFIGPGYQFDFEWYMRLQTRGYPVYSYPPYFQRPGKFSPDSLQALPPYYLRFRRFPDRDYR